MNIFNLYRDGEYEGTVIVPVSSGLEKYLSLDYTLDYIHPNENGEVTIETVGTQLGTILIDKDLTGSFFHDGAQTYKVVKRHEGDSWQCYLIGFPEIDVYYGGKYIRKNTVKR